MRVGYLTNQYPSPTHSFIRREIRSLEAQGIQVKRYTVRCFSGALPDPTDQLEARLVHSLLDQPFRTLVAALRTALSSPARFLSLLGQVLGWRSHSLLRGVAYAVEGAALAAELRSEGIEHLHVHFGTNPLAVAAAARRLGGPPFSVTIHGDEPFHPPWVEGLRSRLELASGVAGISTYGVERLTACAAVQKVQLIRCGLGDDFLTVEPRAIPNEARFLFVGSLSARKQPDKLLDAAIENWRKGLEFDLVFLGDGPLRYHLETAAERSGFKDRVRILGWGSSAQVQHEMDNAQCVVLPSQCEGLPVVLQESLARARPVITSTVGGISDLVDRDVGWLVDPDEKDSIARAMRQVLEGATEDLFARGMRGRSRVLKLHSGEVQGRLMAEFLRSQARPA